MYKICNIYCIGFPPFSGMELLKPLELPKRREEQRCLLLCEPRACGKAPRVGAGGQGSHRDERLAAFGPAPDLEVGLGSITSGQGFHQSSWVVKPPQKPRSGGVWRASVWVNACRFGESTGAPHSVPSAPYHAPGISSPGHS